MKVAVDTRLLIKDHIDGLGQFTFEAFKHIVLKNPTVQFIFIFDRPPHSDFLFAKNIISEVVGWQAKHPVLYKMWYQFFVKRLIKKLQPDVFVGTNGMIPLNTSTKTLSVIHDLNFEHHPEHLPKLLRKYYCKNFPKFAHQATRIATVSEFSKKDIMASYGITSEKVDVVYNGANKNFKFIGFNEKETIQKKYTANCPYFLFVGTLHPRKNLARLFKAFDQFKTATNSNYKLVVVGKKMWWTKAIEQTFLTLNHQKDIVFTGRVNDDELYKITAAATALTYTPIFEGFGIPLVEAMNCGVPIITSNITSMPEVVGDAGLLVSPFSVDEISTAMTTIAANEKLRNELIQKGKIQSQKFSWQKTGDLLWASILSTIKN